LEETLLLQRLSDARGVSGNENEVREILIEEIEPYVDTYRVDNIGNLIATVRAKEEVEKPHRVMVCAHMDEVGLMVVKIEKGGELRFRSVGGIDPRILPAKRVLVGTEAIPGVIGLKPIHLLTREEEKQPVKMEQMYIDIGAKDKDDAASVVKIGDYVSFATHSQVVGRRMMGKAFDDRVGCAILAELVEERYDIELVAAFTVQEEVGLRGARVAGYAVEPELAFALEGTICDDLPRKKDVTSVTVLGKGPAITIMDRSLVADRRLVDLVAQVAKDNGIPYQFKGPGLGGTDAGAVHLAREGVPSLPVAVPSRYIHTPVSLISLDDFENAIALMRASLRYLNDAFPWTRN
jgi:endoglucanase